MTFGCRFDSLIVMNTKEAIKTLKRKGWRVYLKDDYFSVWCGRGQHHGNYSARELVALARCFTSDNRQESRKKKSIKSDYRTSRTFVRDNIQKSNFDSIYSSDDKFVFANRRDYE